MKEAGSADSTLDIPPRREIILLFQHGKRQARVSCAPTGYCSFAQALTHGDTLNRS